MSTVTTAQLEATPTQVMQKHLQDDLDLLRADEEEVCKMLEKFTPFILLVCSKVRRSSRLISVHEFPSHRTCTAKLYGSSKAPRLTALRWQT